MRRKCSKDFLQGFRLPLAGGGTGLTWEECAPYSVEMKLTIEMKLLPTKEQSEILLDTMRRFNQAATFAARLAFDARVFSKPSVHKLVYRLIREEFGLSAQLAIHAMLKACNCFAIDKTKCPVFREDGAVTYDERNMSFKGVNRVSLSTLVGRQVIDMVYGEYQRERFDRIKGQCDLVRRDGNFYLMATIDFQEKPPISVSDFIGVDMGIVSIVTTDDGSSVAGEKVDAVRSRNARARQTYQRRQTRSARRRLRKLSGRQARFQKNVNHVISKNIVAKALTSNCGIAIEDLTGIRKRCEKTVRKSQRSRLSNWSFFQLRSFIEYKALQVGIPVVAVDPRNTSRTCSDCGHCDKANRKNQSDFECKHCGFTCNADKNGAKNIRSRALAVPVRNRDLVATPAKLAGLAASRLL